MPVLIPRRIGDPHTLRVWMESFKNNLIFFLFVMAPILLAVVLIPRFIDPALVEDFKHNFQVIVLNKQYCAVHLEECQMLLDPKFGNPALLKRKYFEHYDMMYIRYFVFEYAENIILHTLDTPVFRKTITPIANWISGPFRWEMFLEAVHLIIALMSSTTFYIITGAITYEMTVFFILGVFLTAIEAWSAIYKAFLTALTSNRITIF